MDIDILVCDIITNELGIDEDRVVVYGLDYEAPKDDNLFVVVSTKTLNVLANINKYNKTTDKEDKSVSSFIDINIELTSKNREAYEKKEEAIMALTSTYSIQQQEKYGFRLFRGTITDLTFVEGGSSLYRFLISCRATNVKNKSTSVDFFDKQRDFTTLIER